MGLLHRLRVQLAALAVLFGIGRSAATELDVPRVAADGWMHFSSVGATNQYQRLEASVNLRDWQELALVHEGAFDFADVAFATRGSRFVRLVTRPLSTQDDGRNQLRLPEDAFLEPPSPPDFARPAQLGWVKFSILRSDETRVWFQHSRKYPYHYDYARLRLAPFVGLSAAEFDRKTLYRTGQEAVLGAVLVPPDSGSQEYGIQFVGQDVWNREEVARWFALVRAAVLTPPGTRPVYVPSFEQESLALAERAWFAEQGIEVGSAARWLTTDAVYAEGWSVGRLVFVAGDRIQEAYAAGTLRPTDILLTDAVPSEIPFVAGVVSLAPATPNSHVAILARGWGVPFVWFASQSERERLRGLVGHDIALRTGAFFEGPHFVDLSGQLTDPLREQLAEMKRPAPLRYTPKSSLGTWTTNVETLTPTAVRYVGGKAANYGLLRRTIPNNCGPGIALTFDVWDAFLDQTVPSGLTLRTEIANKLGGFRYPPEMAALRIRLEEVRTLFTKRAVFSEAQRGILLAALTNGPFEIGRKLRFRSSTNVEDGEDYTGAGLYDSFSGCLADDLDSDTTGPSACDPAEDSERGVFRAIQKVYASFYNENAFLERLRRGVKEDEVGMAVLVHHSYPDVDEMANGVVVLHASRSFGSLGFYGEMVTQRGAISVTNPDSAARPERVNFSSSSGFRSVDLVEGSSLVPLGSTVMGWQKDYLDLVRLLERVTAGYAALVPSKQEFALDLEFKRIQPGRLEIKQVRPLPPNASGTVIPFLFGEPGAWCVEEGEFGSPLAKHRLKSQLLATSDARRLDTAGLATPFYQNAEFTFRVDRTWITLSNGPVTWPEFAHAVKGDEVTDRWSWGVGSDRKQFELRTTVQRSVPAASPAWFVLSDFRQTLQVRYATPQPELTWEGSTPTLVDDVVLRRCPERSSADLPQTRVVSRANGPRLRTRFWWPVPPSGPTAGYTAPNIGFEESELSGFTSQPIVLHAAAAQTYSAGHHNFSETFVFEPRLDSAVPPTQLDELESAGIRILIVTTGFDDQSWWVVDAAGKIRKWP